MRRSMLPIALLMALALPGCAGRLGADQSGNPLPTTSAIPATSDAPSDELAQVVQTYGDAHPDEFAGVYYDREHGGRLVPDSRATSTFISARWIPCSGPRVAWSSCRPSSPRRPCRGSPIPSWPITRSWLHRESH